VIVPWGPRLVRIPVRPLRATPMTRNQLTLISLAVTVVGAAFFATGDPSMVHWGAGLFVLCGVGASVHTGWPLSPVLMARDR
jgi:hypothetical protein